MIKTTDMRIKKVDSRSEILTSACVSARASTAAIPSREKTFALISVSTSL
jgi:hypothetical protein